MAVWNGGRGCVFFFAALADLADVFFGGSVSLGKGLEF